MKNHKPMPPEFANFISYDDGKVFIRPDIAPAFEKIGLITLDAMMKFQQGKLYKRNQEREVLRIELPNPLNSENTLELNATACFMKRHFYTNFNDAFYTIMQGNYPISTARLELEAIAKLEYLGIFTLQPLAFGEEYLPPLGLPGRSFLITQEVTGVKLEQYLRDPNCRFYHDFQLRCRLTTELASIARTMHENYLHHQDFYLGHLLLNWITDEDFTITLIDLQRVRFRNPLDRRWCIKDLAQLYYSISQIPYVTNSDRMRFFRNYLQNSSICQTAELCKPECVAECKYHPNILCDSPPCNDCNTCVTCSKYTPPKLDTNEVSTWLSQIRRKFSLISRHDHKLQARKARKAMKKLA